MQKSTFFGIDLHAQQSWFHVRAGMHVLFNCAVDWGYLDRSPMQGVKPLEAEPSGFGFYTSEQTTLLLSTCRDSEPHWYPFFLCATTVMSPL